MKKALIVIIAALCACIFISACDTGTADLSQAENVLDNILIQETPFSREDEDAWDPALSLEDRRNLGEIYDLWESFQKWYEPWPEEVLFFDQDAFNNKKAAWENLEMEEYTLIAMKYDGHNIPCFDLVEDRFDMIESLYNTEIAQGEWSSGRSARERMGILVIYDPVYHYPKYFEVRIYDRNRVTPDGMGAYRGTQYSFVTSFTPNYRSDAKKTWVGMQKQMDEYQDNRIRSQLLFAMEFYGLLEEGREYTIEEMLEIVLAFQAGNR